MRLLYFVFEFQPIAHAVPMGGSPRVERRGQIHEKNKVNNNTSGRIYVGCTETTDRYRITYYICVCAISQRYEWIYELTLDNPGEI